MHDFLVRFQNLDRRWIFVGMALSILIPMLFPVTFPFSIDQRVQKIYDTIEELPDDSKVFLSADRKSVV